MATKAKGKGTKADPWVLHTPPGTSEYQMYKDEAADPPTLVSVVGKTELRYHLRAIEDLHAMLKKWRLAAAGQRRRAEARRAGHGRGVGPLAQEPGERVVRIEEGTAWPLRHVPAAAPRGDRSRRPDLRPEEQQDARQGVMRRSP